MKYAMRSLVKIKGVVAVSVFLVLSLVIALPVTKAAEEDNDRKELITTKIFEYLKDKKVNASEEKLRTIASSVYEESQRYDIDYRLVLAVMKVESNFRHNALSRKGARGLLQVKPSLARYISKTSDIPVKNSKCLYEPEKNIKIGVNYLSRLIERFENVYTALHAYNAGPRKVKRNTSDDEDEIPNNRFTRKVMKEYQQIADILPDPTAEE
ncbi:MAG: Membrane-bound lytic murein transglycosylase C precursor [Syntrophorhabdus sp. PtaU1.Bin058]|nr:MAG: Membrane-bound lytic murein transglycosylase C precursor [Syntrophorhabdus sp. PtaU1.Bin058]